MNERLKLLAEKATKYADYYAMLSDTGEKEIFTEKFAQLIIFDIFNEITNDDALGPSRVNILRRLSERYGVQRKME